jgi:thiol-disulfide isomerase/thioredoxin
MTRSLVTLCLLFCICFFNPVFTQAEQKSLPAKEKGENVQPVPNERYVTEILKTARQLNDSFNTEVFASFIEKAKYWANQADAGVPPIRTLAIVVQIASSPQANAVDPSLSEKTYEEIITFIRSEKFTVSDEVRKETLEQIKGFQRRFLNSAPELYGKTIDNQDFDRNSLHGKYVLTQFTASWCGPCKRDIPAMKEAYEKFHDKGFEIISVFVWDKLDATRKTVEKEKIPWIVLSEELTEKAGFPPQRITYAIQALPTMFLIGKDGKIISATIRADKLSETLTELLSHEQ